MFKIKLKLTRKIPTMFLSNNFEVYYFDDLAITYDKRNYKTLQKVEIFQIYYYSDLMNSEKGQYKWNNWGNFQILKKDNPNVDYTITDIYSEVKIIMDEKIKLKKENIKNNVINPIRHIKV